MVKLFLFYLIFLRELRGGHMLCHISVVQTGDKWNSISSKFVPFFGCIPFPQVSWSFDSTHNWMGLCTPLSQPLIVLLRVHHNAVFISVINRQAVREISEARMIFVSPLQCEG